ncbi:MAG: hypothetical protein COT84_00190 [Chlamydiae bacterium CG10_big_fil_rev_8_21_14_0_10_35_9]|nr:MAG: hypothetical protein COT84_00190 [Chlamydiae bacterium CG10_big_fil_rev_8_21_14_0_10_35_9]
MTNNVHNYEIKSNQWSFFLKKGVYNPFSYSTTDHSIRNVALAILGSLAVTVLSLGLIPFISYKTAKGWEVVHIKDDLEDTTLLVHKERLIHAAKRTDGYAKYLLGTLYHLKVFKVRDELANSYLTSAANERFLSQDQYYFKARMRAATYKKGEDYIQMMRSAAGKRSEEEMDGIPEANRLLGLHFLQTPSYESGPRDVLRALSFFKKAAKSGDALSLAYVGHILKKNENVSQRDGFTSNSCIRTAELQGYVLPRSEIAKCKS